MRKSDKKEPCPYNSGCACIPWKKLVKLVFGTQSARIKKMAKNAYLEKQRIANKAYFDAGLQMGRQQILDMMCIVLNDPDIMGKDTFGKDRLLKVVKGVGDYIDVFQKAWERDDETDYYRAKLDQHLAKIYGEGMMDTFNKRYEYCTEFNYFTGKWGK